MNNRNFRITPAHLIGFTISFLATDYIIYRQNLQDVNSVVWARLLGSSVGTANPPGDR
jgi:hypothetical protein